MSSETDTGEEVAFGVVAASDRPCFLTVLNLPSNCLPRLGAPRFVTLNVLEIGVFFAFKVIHLGLILFILSVSSEWFLSLFDTGKASVAASQNSSIVASNSWAPPSFLSAVTCSSAPEDFISIKNSTICDRRVFEGRVFRQPFPGMLNICDIGAFRAFITTHLGLILLFKALHVNVFLPCLGAGGSGVAVAEDSGTGACRSFLNSDSSSLPRSSSSPVQLSSLGMSHFIVSITTWPVSDSFDFRRGRFELADHTVLFCVCWLLFGCVVCTGSSGCVCWGMSCLVKNRVSPYPLLPGLWSSSSFVWSEQSMKCWLSCGITFSNISCSLSSSWRSPSSGSSGVTFPSCGGIFCFTCSELSLFSPNMSFSPSWSLYLLMAGMMFRRESLPSAIFVLWPTCPILVVKLYPNSFLRFSLAPPLILSMCEMGGFFAFKIPYLGFIRIFMSEYCLKFLLPLDRDKAAMQKSKVTFSSFSVPPACSFWWFASDGTPPSLAENIFSSNFASPDVGGKNLASLSSFLSGNGSNVGHEAELKILSAKCVCGCTWIFILPICFCPSSDLIRSWSCSWYVLSMKPWPLSGIGKSCSPAPSSFLSFTLLGKLLISIEAGQHTFLSLGDFSCICVWSSLVILCVSVSTFNPMLILVFSKTGTLERMTGEHTSPLFLFCCKFFIWKLHCNAFLCLPGSIRRVDRFCSLIVLYLRLTVCFLASFSVFFFLWDLETEVSMESEDCKKVTCKLSGNAEFLSTE